MRDVRTTVPTGGRTALLRIPLNFVNDASAVGAPLPDGLVPPPVSGGGGTSSGAPALPAADFDFFGSFQPPCPDIDKQTIIDGECNDSFVDQGALGNASDPGACFDVAKCFAGATVIGASDVPPSDGGLTLDRNACILQLNGADPARLNLAIVTADTGECVNPGDCYVPLDHGAAGWTANNGSVQLPSFVCKLLTGKSLRLATSTNTCAAKADANPICRATVPSGGGGGPCTEFVVGTPVDPAIGGSAASQVGVQAIDDYATSAAAAASTATASCKKIAQDLGVTPAQGAAADANADPTAKANAWCTLAATSLGAAKAKAGGSLTVSARPSVCRLSVPAKATCQGSCAGNGTKCDVLANPPVCTGGNLIIACQGMCTPTAGAPSLECQGPCNAQCSGSCAVAAGGVECAGKCSGPCTASASGTGIQPDGTCMGSCQGTCAVTAPGAMCAGACDGSCSGSCVGTPKMPANCNGVCNAGFDPLYCEGGKLQGGCQVDATCDSNCDVSVASSADCPTPTISVSITGAADTTAAATVRATLEANLGALLSLKSRLQGMAQLSGLLMGNAGALTDIKPACIPVVVAASTTAVSEVTGTISALATVLNAVGGG